MTDPLDLRSADLGLPQPSLATCATCCHFADHSDPDDEPDEVNGYCCHPIHSDRAKSPHWEYGGHWTHSESVCGLWEEGEGWVRDE